jgi:adenosylcobinamide-GDP ribazoletransferase
MSGNDISRDNSAFRLNDIRVAFALLTRLPLPFPPFTPARSAASAAWAYPLVGFAIAGITVLTLLGLITLGVPASVAALLALSTSILATGAMHEDGLADCADGFWGGWTRERRLEIMKDSQIGTYGVLALMLAFGLRWQLLIVLIEFDAVLAIIPAAVLSRGAMVWVMYDLPNARTVGLSHQTGKPAKLAAWVAVGLGIATFSTFFGLHAIVPLGLVAVTTIGIAKLARAKIGGQTGDVLGATQQITDITAMLAILLTVYNT